jgi:hypothetical protein
VQDETGPYIGWKHAFLQGHDADGIPLVVVHVRKHKSGAPAEQTAKYVAYSLDTAIDYIDWDRNPAGQLACIFDLRGAPQIELPAFVRPVHCSSVSHTSGHRPAAPHRARATQTINKGIVKSLLGLALTSLSTGMQAGACFKETWSR